MESNTTRGSWNEIISWPTWTRQLEREVETIGAWEKGIESDKRNRGSSINVDLYGYNEAEGLAVVQVRQCIFRPGRFNKVRKDYYLIGRSENGNVFAHPVDTPARSKKALESPEATVRFVLSRIWDCKEEDLPHIVRQGDIAFVPTTLPRTAELTSGNCFVLRDTHRVTGEIWVDVNHQGKRTYYTKRARAVHTKGQHAPVKVRDSWYRIQEGIRAAVWGFTTPKGD